MSMFQGMKSNKDIEMISWFLEKYGSIKFYDQKIADNVMAINSIFHLKFFTFLTMFTKSPIIFDSL